MKNLNLAQLVFVSAIAMLFLGAGVLLAEHAGSGSKIFVYGFWILLVGTSLYIVDLIGKH